MSTLTHFGGIDFSGARGALANLWSAIGVQRDDRLHILSLCPHPFRPDLARFLLQDWRGGIGAADDAGLLCGLDFPLGLSIDAVRRTLGESADWQQLNAWLASHTPDEVAQAMSDNRKTPRACDRDTAMAPLDLRLYKQTVEGARWLHEMLSTEAVSILPHSPTESTLTLIEVYPSVTARDLGIKAPRKPKAPGQVRTRPAALRQYVSFDHPSMEAAAVTLEDAWDAVLAALSVFMVRDDLDQPARVATIDHNQLLIEGFIYRHPHAWNTKSHV